MSFVFPFVRSAALLSILGSIGIALPAVAQSTPPLVQYVPESTSVKLIFENNPERLSVNYTDPTSGFGYSDLADPGLGQKSLLREYVTPGSFRVFFEHLDYTAGTINYGIQVYNPNSTAITVTIRGKGFNTGAYGDTARPVLGGQPFVDLFTTRTATVVNLPAGKSTWVFRSDADYNNARPIKQGDFFSGVVDFDVSGGNVYITNLAYRNFKNLTSWSYMGYITRAGDKPGQSAESRLYKGILTAPVAATTVPFTIGEASAAGDLTVQYPKYVNDGSGNYVPGAAVTGSVWYTNDLPWREDPTQVGSPNLTNVVANDMYDIDMPGFGIVHAFSPTPVSGSPDYANLGNWGVLYHNKVTVTNTGTRTRTLALRLSTQSGGGAPTAYKDATGVWRQTTLSGTPFTYYTFTVAPGATVNTAGYFILGGPAVGRIRQSVTLTN